jgi:predicted lipoprotein with Yx(FWY)xxD motif
MRPVHVRTLTTVAVAAFALAACGSSSKASSPSASTNPPTVAPATTTTVSETTTAAPAANANVKLGTTKLGKVLTDAKGMTLYRFDNDTAAGKSTCTTGACASTWPAATVTDQPAAGTGVDAAKLTTFKTPAGKSQLQIDGHPLYTFAGDSKAGDTNGQGIIGKWYAAGPTGAKVGVK